MCGIAGFAGSGPEALSSLTHAVRRMSAVLEHRGPDDHGVWTDPQAGVALGHRRLAIIDLEPTGAQPAISADGRYVLSFNGEIYNAPELAEELSRMGVRFRGHCDTEVLVELCAALGVDRAIDRLNGMFAFAVWDRAERRLILARDRLGIKPLYWTHCGGRLLFASELKALQAHGGVPSRIDREALASFLRYGYVPAPASIFERVYKLEPGCRLSWQAGAEPAITRYWDLRAVAQQGVDHRSASGAEDVSEQVEPLLSDAVRRQMVADVPVGCLLSGGIDSSLIAMLMQANSSRPVRTFTVGFREADFDEAAYAHNVARYLGTEHTEIYVDAAAALDTIPGLAQWYDEPFADSSQIPTRIVSRLARDHVKVALSGDGGDEVFAGYNRYFWALSIQRTMRVLPLPARRALAALCRRSPAAAIETMLLLVPRAIRPIQIREKTQKLAEILALRDANDVYRRLISQWADPEMALLPDARPPAARQVTLDDTLPEPMERMQYLDSVTYLPDDILTKVDRASMSVGLEVRVPLLDHRVVEFAWRLPPSLKVSGKQGKMPLRRMLYRRMPRALIDRPKQGFALPLADWLRGPLRGWAEDLLSEKSLRETGLLDPAVVRARWADHLHARRDWSYAIWTVLMFLAWLHRSKAPTGVG